MVLWAVPKPPLLWGPGVRVGARVRGAGPLFTAPCMASGSSSDNPDAAIVQKRLRDPLRASTFCDPDLPSRPCRAREHISGSVH